MKPISNGIVTLHDENDNDKGAFNCMQLIKFLTADGCTEWTHWHKAHLQAKAGKCPFRNQCDIFHRTTNQRQPLPLFQNLNEPMLH